MARLSIFVSSLVLAAGRELQLSSEVDAVTGSLFVVEKTPGPVISAPGNLRRCAKYLPPSVTVAAAIWALITKEPEIEVAVEEAAEELAEHLHIPLPQPEPQPEPSRALRLRWALPLSLLAFGLAMLQRRRRRRGVAKDLPAVTAPADAEAEGPSVKRHVVQMFRISTEQPDEEPEPPEQWRRMMTNLSDISDRPLELGNQTEIFRMQTQEMLSSNSAANSAADAGEEASDKQPSSGHRLSSSAESAESGESSPSGGAQTQTSEDTEQEAQMGSSKEAPSSCLPPAPTGEEPAEPAEPAEPRSLPSVGAVEESSHSKQSKQSSRSSQSSQSSQGIQGSQDSPRPASSGHVPSPRTTPRTLKPPAPAHSARASRESPERAEQEPLQVKPLQAEPRETSPRQSMSRIATQHPRELSQETASSSGRGRISIKTPNQQPAGDTPRKMNSSLIGAPKDKIRAIAKSLTEGKPPTYSPNSSRQNSPSKSKSSRSPEKTRKV